MGVVGLIEWWGWGRKEEREVSFLASIIGNLIPSFCTIQLIS